MDFPHDCGSIGLFDVDSEKCLRWRVEINLWHENLFEVTVMTLTAVNRLVTFGLARWRTFKMFERM